MKVPDQADLSWDLLDVVRTGLDIPAINRVSMAMAGGDYPTVIEMLLAAAVDASVQLSGDMCARLDEWMQFYSAYPSSARLRLLLDDVTREADE